MEAERALIDGDLLFGAILLVVLTWIALMRDGRPGGGPRGI